MSHFDLAAVRGAHDAIARDIVRTPLVEATYLRDHFPNARVFLKCENLQRTGSFKDRGAHHAVACLSDEARKRGVVTRSSGNFGQALACAARRHNVPVTVVMPTTAPVVKMEGVRRFGGNIVQIGTSPPEGLAEAYRLRDAQGLTFVAPYDDVTVMAGQGTLALEAHAQLPTMRRFYAPVGGGGLMSGCSAALKELDAKIDVVAVEPEGASDFVQSLQRGVRTSVAHTQTIADGLLPHEVGEHCWPVLQRCVDRAVLVAEDVIAIAMAQLYQRAGFIVEPSGAVALAGLLSDASVEGDVVCVVSGGNVDRARFDTLIQDR